ncbi:ABC transporter ATP-binding protein/permease [Flavobacterium sp. CBA20B-1]|uniref:ABC transporter ATP-binding protein n=1 Tax=unclassified Flavobacterium TaxID=196869 RepID=UPI0022249F6D|nr:MULTISPECIES: ABC transporter ATP-binding protein [unclassified Flavobacterium]WCM41759.1 ABC transporter ATP-binding protein/permease [Flavobacterium sp. CBA20B-1]
MKELQKLNKYFIKYKYRFLIGIVITIASQIFTVFTPQYIGDAITVLEHFLKNELTAEATKKALWHNMLLIIGTTLTAGFLTFLMRQTIIVMSRNIEFDLKNEIYDHYQKLSLDFYKRQRTGDLMSRISEDVAKVRQYVGPAVMYSINTVFRMAVVIVQMYIISPTLTWYSLIPVPFLAILMYKLSTEINRRSFAYQQNLSKLSSFSQEIFSGIRVIKAYTLENRENTAYDLATTESKSKFMRLTYANALIGPLMILLIGISNLLIVFIGARMYINGVITEIGIIAQFILYINMLTWPIASLGWVSSMIQEADSSQKRINEFLNEEPSIQSNTTEQHLLQGKIEFHKVHFTYEDTNIQALNNISFTIEKGETVAFLGKTGSGKSTILQLISRLYDVSSGSIAIDGIDIKNWNVENLRDQIAVVPQDAFLFSDTIKTNIQFGKENATQEEIEHYAKIADVHKNIIRFENGYETILGERGITLSGGQKQRVSIARALIKDAPVLLLDDCLSAVDTETEERILNNLKDISAKKTTLIVTHRVSSAKNADKIIILNEGEILEQGTHFQLLKQNGYYADLYNKQLAEKDVL